MNITTLTVPRAARKQANGVTPFRIAIVRESESELKDLYGDGCTIIDDILSLPERMPNIYRRLTS